MKLASKAGKSLLFTLPAAGRFFVILVQLWLWGVIRRWALLVRRSQLDTTFYAILQRTSRLIKSMQGKLIQDWMSVVGGLTGGPGVQLGRVIGDLAMMFIQARKIQRTAAMDGWT